jgi:zinc transport system ATP-binding protein
METLLKVRNLSVELNGEKIISNLSFELKRGQIITILGPNGAGKTTLLRALLGIIPYKGKIKWKRGIKIGYVPQRVPFVKDFPISVKEFLKLKSKDENEIKEIIKIVGFDEKILNKNISELSSGQYQRILFAWSLLGNPDVILLDEPTSGIDIVGERTIYQILKKLKDEKKISAILVTHDLSVVFKYSDYCICLNKVPICQGKPKKINQKNLERLYNFEIKFYKHVE